MMRSVCHVDTREGVRFTLQWSEFLFHATTPACDSGTRHFCRRAKAKHFARSRVPLPNGAALPLYLKRQGDAYWFEYLDNLKLVYFQFNRVQNDAKETIAKFSERLFDFLEHHDVEKLVIDMRWNKGGNNFLNAPILEGLIRSTKINQPGKLFVIVGRNTFSAAMCGATKMERYTKAINGGEPSRRVADS
jgi:hypothetical protein